MPQQQQEELDWKTILRDSIWLSVAWEWLQTLLSRAAEPVLWVTMIFSCYQLIPGVSVPPQNVSTFMFVLQFIALDVGGMGLNQLARQQELDRWAYSRVVAYILIGITLVTISYAGIEHAVKIDASVTGWIEVLLVIARSVMTVLYGQAIHALKEADRSLRNRLAELEALVPPLHQQLNSEQQTVSGLRQRLSSLEQEVNTGRSQLAILRGHLENKQTEVESGQNLVRSLKDQAQELTEQLKQVTHEKQDLVIQVNRSELQVTDLTSKLEQAAKQVRSLTLQMQELTSSSTGHKEVRTKRSQVSSHRSEQVNNGSQGTVLQLVPKQGEERARYDPHEVKAWCDAHVDLTQAEQAAQLGISDAANLRRLLRRARELEGTTGHVANDG